VTHVRKEVWEEHSASIIRVRRIRELGTLAVTSNRRVIQRNTKWERKLVWNTRLRMQWIRGDYEEWQLLVCGTMWILWEPTFRRNAAPPSSGWKGWDTSQMTAVLTIDLVGCGPQWSVNILATFKWWVGEVLPECTESRPRWLTIVTTIRTSTLKDTCDNTGRLGCYCAVCSSQNRSAEVKQFIRH
jgi:hypothetical protein